MLEVLVATAVTLLMMVSLAQIFKIIGDSMKQGRSALELNNRLRGVALRISNDIQNFTIVPDPPTDLNSGAGYLKIYDGPITDFSTTQLSTAAPIGNMSRFGDVDDIIMGTIRANDVWFTGKVPLFVLRGGASSPPAADDFDLVTIAAQHAEIAIFVQPMVTNIGNPTRNTNHFLTAGLGAFQDTDDPDPTDTGDTDGIANGLPDSYRIHYRTLLVRPDLNLLGALVIPGLGTASAGSLPAAIHPSGSAWLLAQPQTTPVALPTPMCDMSSAHVQCDLSLRRVALPAGTDGMAAADFVSANSLEDLVNPGNRFAHYHAPVANGTSMPLLALGPTLGALNTSGASPPWTVPATGTGFLHPAFTLRGIRAGEDLLASDVLGFDVKVFDPGVPLLITSGPDGVAGTVLNDDQDGSTDEADELGWAGSDDVVLTPNDPGYAQALYDLDSSTPGFASVIGTGAYVDIAWGQKTLFSLPYHGLTTSSYTGLSTMPNLWSQFSGLSAANFASGFPYTDALYKSGLCLQTSAGSTPVFYQPSFDSWSERYEGDGILQSEQSGARGATTITNTSASGPALRDTWRRPAAGVYYIDAGTDGFNNNPGSDSGVDDVAEKETSPPFAVRLRGLQISIRMEDPETRQVRQMSLAKEFITE